MTNKQILINDVDVSGCEFYFDEKCRCMDASIMQDFYSCPQCNSNPNCYYKNYKRKEQECKKLYIQLKADAEYHKEEENTLRKIIKNKEERNIELYKENNKLKTENDELKAKIKYMEEYIKTVENARNEVERENKFSKEQAEQKLERIKEMLKKCVKIHDDIIVNKSILQIIDEVE